MQEKVEFYLGDILLPINPPNFELDPNGNNEIINIVSLGEVVIPKKRGLFQNTLSSYFPKEYETTPHILEQKINAMWEARSPISLVVTGLNQADYLVVIDDFTTDRRSGEHEDIYYTINVTEYVPYGAIEMYIPSSTENSEGEITAPPQPPPRTYENKPPTLRTHTVVRGDTLWAITRTKTGDPNRWRELYDLNKSVIINGVYELQIGTVLNIPESWV